MKKEIEIHGCLEVQPDISMDEVIDKFIDFVEANGWYFGGGYREIIDGYYINCDGTKGKHMADD